MALHPSRRGRRRDLWKHAIIYTTEQGGMMKTQPMWATPEQYEEAKRSGYLVDPSKDTEERIPLAMVALVDVVEVWDFRIRMTSESDLPSADSAAILPT